MKRLYGGTPLHLLGHVLVFGVVAYAVAQIFVLGDTGKILLWLAGAVVLHDAIMWPLYSGANTVIGRALGATSNYVRVPLGLSLVLGIVFISTISGKGESTYESASGEGWDGYLARWLIVSAALAAISGAAFLVRRSRSSPTG